MIEPIHYTDRHVLLDILNRGFRRPESYWSDGLARIQLLGGNAVAGVPLGYIMVVKGRNVGVVLTPASVRLTSAGTRGNVINLSSWYVDPEYRWRAPLMLKSVLQAHDALFTDLTPTPEVYRINVALGFQPISQGLIVTPLPLASVGVTKRVRVRDLDAGTAADLPDGIGPFLVDHKKLDCIPAAIETPDGLFGLMFRRVSTKMFPCVELVYCQSTAVLAAQLTSVARYLRTKGLFTLIADDTGQELRLSQYRRRHGARLARVGGGLSLDRGRLDYAGSELCCLPI